MPKSKTLFVCNNCGNEFPRWEGQCRACGAWNTLEEIKTTVGFSRSTSNKRSERIQPVSLKEIDASAFERTPTGIDEVDRTIGGGLVSGQVILLGGQPGIGKSTILIQLADKFKGKVLYASGEESESQIALRAKRLQIDNQTIEIVSNSDIDAILESFNHDLLIIDSIQVVATSDIAGQSGSVSQVRECAARIINFAKTRNIPAIIVGHITKEGALAGPKILEHMVDTVLYLEGDRDHLFRMMRVYKNRFGDDSEVGIFTMEATGLQGVSDPTSILIANRSQIAPGTSTAIILEGSRPLAIEVQALTTKTSFGYPKRAASGFSLNRLQLLCAVVQKRTGANLLDQDVYLNIASGINVKEPAVDLAVCAAIISSFYNKPIKDDHAFFGEVGLSGEVRNVVAAERRLKEAKKFGFTKIINPQNTNNINLLTKTLI